MANPQYTLDPGQQLTPAEVQQLLASGALNASAYRAQALDPGMDAYQYGYNDLLQMAQGGQPNLGPNYINNGSRPSGPINLTSETGTNGDMRQNFSLNPDGTVTAGGYYMPASTSDQLNDFLTKFVAPAAGLAALSYAGAGAATSGGGGAAQAGGGAGLTDIGGGYALQGSAPIGTAGNVSRAALINTGAGGAAPVATGGAGTFNGLSVAKGAGATLGGGSALGAAAPAAGGGGLLSAAGQWLGNNSTLATTLAGAALGAYSGGQDQTNSTTATSTYTPSQEYLNYANPAFNAISQYGLGSAPAYSGPSSIGAYNFGGSQAGVSSAGLGGTIGVARNAYDNLSAAENQEMAQVRQMIEQAGAGYDAAYNPYSSSTNPYIDKAVEASTRGLVSNYNNVVAPKFSMGSSFGSSGLGFAEALERDNLQRNIGDISTGINYNAYNLAADLSEKYAGRQDAASQFQSQQQLAGAGLLGGFGESYAGRQDAAQQAQAAGYLGIGNTETQNNQFNTGQSNAAAIANAQLAQSAALGNAQLSQSADQFNANFAQNQYKIGLDETARRINALQNGLSAAQSGFGGTTTQTQTGTIPGNAASGALGGALLGSQLGQVGAVKKSTGQGLFDTNANKSVFKSNYQGF